MEDSVRPILSEKSEISAKMKDAFAPKINEKPKILYAHVSQRNQL